MLVMKQQAFMVLAIHLIMIICWHFREQFHCAMVVKVYVFELLSASYKSARDGVVSYLPLEL